MPEITVLLATHNGERVLPRALEGYRLQNDAGFPWKLVIVDNASTDRTSDIIRHYQSLLRIDPMFEPISGKNRALNKGLRAIEGEAIIVTDDDAIADAGFLAAWRRVLSLQPAYDVFGGAIEPLFDLDPPEWMLRGRTKFEELFAARNLPEGAVTPGEIFGPNMAVRRSVFDRGLKFSESIGPDGADPNYAMGSETEFCIRAYANGHKTWFAQEPRVRHIVRAHQLELKFCSQRAYRNGRGRADMIWSGGVPERRLGFSEAAIAAGNAYQNVRQYLRWCRTWTPVPADRLDAVWEYHWHRGFRDEYAKRMKAHRSCLAAKMVDGKP